jgi:ABC-type nitrate/sulfonate/bicarbonate transport system substrate-binding protein
MRKFKIIGVILLIAAAITVTIMMILQNSPDETSDLRIGILRHESSLPIYIADELGFFKQNDVNVKLNELPPGDHMPALISDRVDIISPTSFPVLFGVMSENPDLLYAVFPGAEIEDGPILYGIIVKNDFVGSSIYDLKNKSIMAINPFTKINIETILFSAGIVKNEWPTIKVSSREAALSAILDNTVDAAIMDQPQLAVALSSPDFKLLEANPRAKYIGSPYWSGAGGVKRKNWIAKEKTFKKMMFAIDQALDYIEKNNLESHQILAKRMGLEYKIANQMGGYYFPKSTDTVNISKIKSTAVILIEAGLLNKEVSFNNFFPINCYGQ